MTTPPSQQRGKPPSVLRVVVDADVSLPPVIAERLGILVAPEGVPLMLERENIPRLMLKAGAPLDPSPIVEAARRGAAEGADVLYVGPGDQHGHPTDAEQPVREAVEAAGQRLHVITSDVLMASGWRAVVAAEASEAGATPEEAVERARGATTHLLALIEHPELTGQQAPGNLGVPNRVVTLVHDDGFALDALPPRREDGLRLLRDRFASMVPDASNLRVVVHFGGVGPAGEAMATWIERHVQPQEVHVTAITRHAATRHGPGFVGIAWLQD